MVTVQNHLTRIFNDSILSKDPVCFHDTKVQTKNFYVTSQTYFTLYLFLPKLTITDFVCLSRKIDTTGYRKFLHRSYTWGLHRVRENLSPFSSKEENFLKDADVHKSRCVIRGSYINTLSLSTIKRDPCSLPEGPRFHWRLSLSPNCHPLTVDCFFPLIVENTIHTIGRKIESKNILYIKGRRNEERQVRIGTKI